MPILGQSRTRNSLRHTAVARADAIQSMASSSESISRHSGYRDLARENRAREQTWLRNVSTRVQQSSQLDYAPTHRNPANFLATPIPVYSRRAIRFSMRRLSREQRQ